MNALTPAVTAQVQTNNCKDYCDNGYRSYNYFITTSNSCSPCRCHDTGQGNCVGAATNCTVCEAGFVLSSINNTCLSCPSNCAQCTEIACAKCFARFYLDSDHICQPCFLGCSACKGPLSTECANCPHRAIGTPVRAEMLFVLLATHHAGLAKDLLLINARIVEDSNHLVFGCSQTCPHGTYPAFINFSKCWNCDPSCAQCTNSQRTQCQACNPGYFLEGTTCKTYCVSSALYANSTTNKCETCDPTCLSCDGGSAFNCTACNSSTYLKLGKSCFITCPDGY